MDTGRHPRTVTDGGEPAGGSAEDRTAVVEELFDPIPFHQVHDIEVVSVTPERAETRLPYQDSLVGNVELQVLHGGAISALMDLTGAAVFIGGCHAYTPTVDLRVNYLEAAGQEPLRGVATVERRGENIGVAHLEARSGGSVCATGSGVYKLSND